jgi:hypothetical protein
MDELLELIARIGTDDPPSAEELTEARTQLVELLRTATAEQTRDLDAAAAIREAIDTIDTETTRVAEAAAAEDAEARRLLEGIEPAATEGDPAPEGEPEGDPEGAAREAEPVAASTGRTSLRAAVRRTALARGTNAPEEASHIRVMGLGVAQGERLGRNASLRDVATLFTNAAPRVKNRGQRESLVRIEYDFPEDRRLFASERVDNDRLMDAVMGFAPGAVAAAGGICDPLPADFVHPIFGDRGRPIRDALPRFQAARGGVRFSPAATMADLADAVGVWTYEQDSSPGESQKLCLVLECEDEDTAHVDAITACLQVGNFQARFNPEFWRSRLDLLMVRHDNEAELALYADMDAASTQVTYGTGEGTIYSVLTGVDKAAAGLRSRLRLTNRTVMRALLPAWVRDALRADITRQRLGSSPAEHLAVADRVIDTFFSARNVSPIWSPDLDPFGAQSAGALLDWPGGNVEFLIFPEGTFFHLDGGALDLGTEIIDSTLVRQNNRMAFLETFERAVFRGGESLAVTVPVDEACICADVAVVEATS